MIVKGSQRSGGRALAAHLLNLHDNDHVELHSVSGLVSTDVAGAFLEIEAVSRATRCKQPFFSVSISPPKGETVLNIDFENAIAQIAEATGLAGQPRVVIFHEKQARRHCHVVFSRIDTCAVKAINLPFFKRRLTEISRELYLAHGFEMPQGLADKSLADPTNFSLEEWQVAKRADRDAREIKATLKKCWTVSDGAQAFKAALKERGFWLCRGDRRGFVALDYKGNVYSLSRWLDVKPKEIKVRLGEPERLPTVTEAKSEISTALTAHTRRLQDEIELSHREKLAPLVTRHREMVIGQRQERLELSRAHKRQREEQSLSHAQRVRRGFSGFWDWLTGRRAEAKRTILIEVDEMRAMHANAQEKLRSRHIIERKILKGSFLSIQNSRDTQLNMALNILNTGTQAREAFTFNRSPRQLSASIDYEIE